VSTADYLSLVRIPLGFVFLAVAGDLPLALAVMAVAGLSDVLDGWMARRHRPPDDHAHHRGDWLDPLCDKVFVTAVVVGIYLQRHPPIELLLLLLTREILQTAAVTTMRLVPALHRVSRDYNFKAHPVGKATTVMQFFACTLLLIGHPLATAAVWVTAALGALTVAIYVSRVRALLPSAPEPRVDPQVRRIDR
jgi:phosphatidylglycerophosphate synthase